MSATLDGDFVVFLIGMRVNKAWKLHKWIPVARAMGPMLRLLSKSKDLGLLGFNTWIGPRGPLIVQYWRSVDHLERFAARRACRTSRPGARSTRRSAASGDVGVWHETYLVKDGAYEAVYANMPRFGLAAAGTHVLISASTFAAQRRAATRRTERRSARTRAPGVVPAVVHPGRRSGGRPAGRAAGARVSTCGSS